MVDQVAVQVQSDAGFGVTEPAADHENRNPLIEHKRGSGVAGKWIGRRAAFPVLISGTCSVTIVGW